MNVLILGGGAREHAMAWKLAQSPSLDQLFVVPGNGARINSTQTLNIDIGDFEQIAATILDKDIGLLLVGPELPLVQGLRDYLHGQEAYKGLLIVGPGRDGAQLEGSKAYAKAFMLENNIPTAAYHEVSREEFEKGVRILESMRPPYVLKADGLAAGKGVIITKHLEEAKDALHDMLQGKFGQASRRVVIESFLEGVEFSVFILLDGSSYVLLPEAKDYKRIGEGDKGLNTGGMGAVSPVPFVDAKLMQKVKEKVIEPTLVGLKKRKIDYRGFLFFGLICCDGDPYVIEYNCRMGDPETQAVLPRINNDFLDLLVACAKGELEGCNVEHRPEYLCNFVLASKGYPQAYAKNKKIELPRIDDDRLLLFHAGTRSAESGELLTNGGRVLSCCAFGNTLEQARRRGLELAEAVQFEGKYFRKDIGLDLITQ